MPAEDYGIIIIFGRILDIIEGRCRGFECMQTLGPVDQ
jgi:hypothetical protein